MLLKLVKATQKGEKLKQGCNVTGDQTQDLRAQIEGRAHKQTRVI